MITVLADLAEDGRDFVDVHGQLGQAYVLLVNLGGDLGFDFRFGDVVDGQIEAETCQCTRPRGVSLGDGDAVEAAAFGVGCAQKDHQIFAIQGLGDPLDFFLTVQVKGACGRSNEAVGGFEGHLGPCALCAEGDGCALNAVALAQGDGVFAFQFHGSTP